MNLEKIANLISVRNFLEIKANSNHSLGSDTERKLRLVISTMDGEIVKEAISYLEPLPPSEEELALLKIKKQQIIDTFNKSDVPVPPKPKKETKEKGFSRAPLTKYETSSSNEEIKS